MNMPNDFSTEKVFVVTFVTGSLRDRLHQASAQQQLCDNACDFISLKTMDSLENRLQTHSGATPLFLMRTVLL